MVSIDIYVCVCVCMRACMYLWHLKYVDAYVYVHDHLYVNVCVDEYPYLLYLMCVCFMNVIGKQS